MLDEKTTLKLKDVAKKLGKDWIVDLVNSKERNIIFKRGRDLEINLYKKWGTKCKYTIRATALCSEYRSNLTLINSNNHETQLNLSSVNIANKIISAIPANVDEIIQKEHIEAKRKHQEYLMHEYFIHALSKMGKLEHCNNYDNHKDCSIAINNHDVRIVHVCNADLYTFSVKIDRDMIIKMLRILNE